MKVTLRKVGNSQGVIIPKAVIAQLGIEDGLEMTVEQDAIILHKPAKATRYGWAEASSLIAQAGDDKAVWPEFANEGDAELSW